MRIELICIGSELISGKLNTNITYLSEKLNSIGLGFSLVSTVGDHRQEMENTFRRSINQSSIVILTGGLGPTFDDLTREVVSKVLNRPLMLNREALSSIAKFFVDRNTDMPKNNERQAYIIEGAAIITNRIGTAPGQIIETETITDKKTKLKCTIFLLPGPPREMQAMFEETVFEYLKKFEKGMKKSFILHIFGLRESEVDEKIRPIIETEKTLDKENIEFTILAHQMIIDIKVSISGKDEMLIDETLHNLKLEFYNVLGENIYGESTQTLEAVVGSLLSKYNKTLCTAESCTGGLLSHRITSIPGSSLYFRQGFVVYSNESKIKTLGISKETITEFGAVSEQTAQEMAEKVKETTQTDYAISVTGIAGPSGGTNEKPVGLVYICLIGPDIKEVFRFNFKGNRNDIRQRATNQALDLLRRQLIKLDKVKHKAPSLKP